ncbi:DMT family transporter [Fusibacter sp. JL298sf-3]
MSQKMKGLISVMVPVVVWGISFVSTEVLLDKMGPMTIGAVRFVIATAMLYAMMRYFKQPMAIEKGDRKLFWLAGGVGIGLYFYFENTGILYLSAAPSALIIAAIPMFTLIFEAIVFKRAIDKVDILAIVISIVGVVCVMDIRLSDLKQGGAWFGYAAMIGAVFSWVIYSLASRPLFKKYSYLTIIYNQFLYALPFFVVVVPFESNRWQHLVGSDIIHLVFLSVFASVLGFYFYAKAMDLLGVTEASLYINFLPIVTLAFGYVYLGQTISLTQTMGGILIILSLTVTGVREKGVEAET